MAKADRWDQVFACEEQLFTKEPNAFLAEVVRGLAAGRALDIGMGQGRNAIWLAERGWDVTGLDISGEGVRQAREGSSKMRVVHQSAEEFAIGKGEWDLSSGCTCTG